MNLIKHVVLASLLILPLQTFCTGDETKETTPGKIQVSASTVNRMTGLLAVLGSLPFAYNAYDYFSSTWNLFLTNYRNEILCSCLSSFEEAELCKLMHAPLNGTYLCGTLMGIACAIPAAALLYLGGKQLITGDESISLPDTLRLMNELKPRV